MTRLLYIANLRLPTEKAYGIQIARMCEAFASTATTNNQRPTTNDRNLEIELIVPRRENEIKDDFFEYYSIKRNFKFKKFWAPDFYFPGRLDRISVLAKDLISAVILVFYGIFSGADIIYSRDEWPLYFVSFLKKNIVFEAHRFSPKRNLFYTRFRNKKIKTVVISEALKQEFLKLGFRQENILVAHDGVDLDEFDIPISKNEARDRVGLPQDAKIVMYTGHLFTWKGSDTLAMAAKLLPEVKFVFVGGTNHDLTVFRKKFGSESNIMILGHKPHKEMPVFLKAADVLVLPNSAKEEISHFTSPIKLFEYMASGRPIVATNLPSIREVLNDKNSILAKPDDINSLAQGIRRVLDNNIPDKELAKKAREDVENYTWAKRASSILNFLG